MKKILLLGTAVFFMAGMAIATEGGKKCETGKTCCKDKKECKKDDKKDAKTAKTTAKAQSKTASKV